MIAGIKHSIEEHFGFLKDAGFSPFQEEQIAYEYHFTSSNNYVKIDIYFELISSSPVWINIGGYFIEDLEPGLDWSAGQLAMGGEVLRRHPEVLQGDVSEMKKNEEIRLGQRKQEEAAERIRKGIYTVECSLFMDDEYDVYQEFEEMEEMRKFIEGLDKPYRILDPYMKEVKIDFK